ETVEPSVNFQNTGNALASGLSGKFRIPSPFAGVLDSVYSLGNIAAGGSGGFSNGVVFNVPPSVPDGTVLPLTFVTTNGSATWTDHVNRVVHPPKLKLTLLKIDDSVTGNNDGVIQAGEVFDLVTNYKNYGSGASDGLTGVLFSADPDVVVSVPMTTITRINSMQELAP